ncbi:MAG: hypothetical protein Q8Q89_03835 [bacterium]|nr:hypothetical protein [bacterium]
MTEEDVSVPFYLMKSVVNCAADKYPSNVKEVIDGLNKAIEATRRRICEYKNDKADTSELDVHLKSLEAQLERAKNK